MPWALEMLRDDQQRGTCRSCGKPITWATAAETGRRLILDGHEPVSVKTGHRPSDWAQTETYGQDAFHKCTGRT